MYQSIPHHHGMECSLGQGIPAPRFGIVRQIRVCVDWKLQIAGPHRGAKNIPRPWMPGTPDPVLMPFDKFGCVSIRNYTTQARIVMQKRLRATH